MQFFKDIPMALTCLMVSGIKKHTLMYIWVWILPSII